MPDGAGDGEALIAGGPFALGAAADQPWAYDNELPAHEADLQPFAIDRALVTNEEYVAFVAAGGYRDRSLWSDEGWAWREVEDAVAPEYWRADGAGGWLRRRFDLLEPVPPRQPVQHVSYWEADAYARWSGKRLPSEPEWEKAARSRRARAPDRRGLAVDIVTVRPRIPGSAPSRIRSTPRSSTATSTASCAAAPG